MIRYFPRKDITYMILVTPEIRNIAELTAFNFSGFQNTLSYEYSYMISSQIFKRMKFCSPFLDLQQLSNFIRYKVNFELLYRSIDEKYITTLTSIAFLMALSDMSIPTTWRSEHAIATTS